MQFDIGTINQFLPFLAYIASVLGIWIKFTNKIVLIESKLADLEKRMATAHDEQKAETALLHLLNTQVSNMMVTLEFIKERIKEKI